MPSRTVHEHGQAHNPAEEHAVVVAVNAQLPRSIDLRSRPGAPLESPTREEAFAA